MLRILYSRAGKGKTANIMYEIKQKMLEGHSNMLLIVPEQYSHYAERQLCKICGDSMSLHAEVLTFTRLCGHVFEETGGAREKILNKSGRILVMHKAFETVLPSLKVFNIKKTRTQMLESLLTAVLEFKNMRVTPELLEEIVKCPEIAGNPLADKLHDFALITGAYNALLETYGKDASERLELLASKIKDSSLGKGSHIYFDGFNDFTALELNVINQLIVCGADVTVCLTCELDESEYDPGYTEIFKIPRETIATLSNLPIMKSNTEFVKAQSKEAARKRADQLIFMEQHLFDDVIPKYKGIKSKDAIEIIETASCYEQCLQAAKLICKFNKSGYRWRDIAVMARDFAQYDSMCEHVFDKHGIPYFSGGNVNIDSKPPIALINDALDIVITGFEKQSVVAYLKTGLLKFDVDDIARLENYISMWNIKGSAWQKEWTLPPSGYNARERSDEEKEADEQLLERLNQLRKEIVKPLIRLSKGITQENADKKIRALYDFICEIELSKRLALAAEEFTEIGQLRMAREYIQLTEIIIDALDQMYTVLGESKLTKEEFQNLVLLVLSQHEVGVIPISLDEVSMGGMEMSRRRDIKCLIILGATDDNMPCLVQSAGVLSDNERAILSRIDKKFPAGLEERLYREMNMLYSTITLASDKLILIYDTSTGKRPTYLIPRLCDMFDLSVTGGADIDTVNANTEESTEKNTEVQNTSNREPLTATAAQTLYGKNLILSPSRVDSYYSCPYKHFLKNGLLISPQKAAEFDAASAGNYTHFILDKVFNELIDNKTLKTIDNNMLTEMAGNYSKQFVKDTLFNFEGKDERFKYLFNHYEQSVMHMLVDMVEELKNSDFTPVEFEMDISEITNYGRGYIDRVDKYEKDGKLYLRVIDYKTRKSAYEFNLCDIYNGRDMQMLIYLFTLQRFGAEKFGKEPIPAGVLYVPAREAIVSVEKDASHTDIEKKRRKQMQRSGLILDEDLIINAMEKSEDKRFLPSKDGAYVSTDKFKLLSEHVQSKISEATTGILSGRIDCNPYYKSNDDNACMYCEYFAVCRFDEENGDKYDYVTKEKDEKVWEKLRAASNLSTGRS